MSRFQYDDKFIKCPFFISENSSALKCEGGICQQQIYIFSSTSGKRKYKQKYCTNRYCECKNYKEVSGEYE